MKISCKFIPPVNYKVICQLFKNLKKKIWLETLPEGNQSLVPKVNLLKAKPFEILKKNYRFSGFFGKVYYKNGKVVVFAQGLLIVCKLDSSSHSCNLFDYKSWLFVKISPIFKIRSSPPRAQKLGLNYYICYFCLQYKILYFSFFLEIDLRYQGLFSSGKISSQMLHSAKNCWQMTL